MEVKAFFIQAAIADRAFLLGDIFPDRESAQATLQCEATRTAERQFGYRHTVVAVEAVAPEVVRYSLTIAHDVANQSARNETEREIAQRFIEFWTAPAQALDPLAAVVYAAASGLVPPSIALRQLNALMEQRLSRPAGAGF